MPNWTLSSINSWKARKAELREHILPITSSQICLSVYMQYISNNYILSVNGIRHAIFHQILRKKTQLQSSELWDISAELQKSQNCNIQNIQTYNLLFSQNWVFTIHTFFLQFCLHLTVCVFASRNSHFFFSKFSLFSSNCEFISHNSDVLLFLQFNSALISSMQAWHSALYVHRFFIQKLVHCCHWAVNTEVSFRG